MIYEPDAFAGVNLERHRLSLGDEDRARFSGAQKAIAEGHIDPDLARYDRMRRGIDRALKVRGVDIDAPEAAEARSNARNWLDGFDAIEGRPPYGGDIDTIVVRAIGDGADTAAVPEASSSFDPQHIVPAGGGRPPSRPPAPPPRPAPSPGHNNPPRPLSPYEQAIENTRRLLRPSPTLPPQPQPDTAGPAASATRNEKQDRGRKATRHPRNR